MSGPMKIVVVDDDSEIIALLSATVRSEYPRATVKTARSTREAIPIIMAEQPDFVISDIRMPGIDGRELKKLTEMRHGKRTVFAYITGISDETFTDEEWDRIKDSDGFFRKPFKVDEILAWMKSKSDPVSA